MGRQILTFVMTRRKTASFWRSFRRAVTNLLAVFAILVALCASSHADPADYNGFATLGFQGFFSWIDGRIGFEQQNIGVGTLDDLKTDLGLPAENRTYRILASVRPLEHHLLRLFGSIPETYRGNKTLNRQLSTRNFVYQAGTVIESELRTAMFGFGYDLDFFIGPRWYGGLNGDLRYIDLRIRMGNNGSALPDTISLAELVPCLGAHVETRFPCGLGNPANPFSFGGFARMTYGMTPNFLNYVDVSVGVSALARPSASWLLLSAKLGYEHESYFHNQENIAGKTLELSRDGFMFSLEVAF